VAQLGSAPALGAGGRRFKSCRVDVDYTDYLKLFSYDHLAEHLQKVSSPFANLALEVVKWGMPPNFTINTLWKLWEAKNLAVVAAAQF
jgi:hypothetical protein